MDIQAGMEVVVTTARNELVRMIARSGETTGRDTRIVWVSEIEAYANDGEDAYALPWPAGSVRRAEVAS